MKKIHNKAYQDILAQKHYRHDIDRKSKKYDPAKTNVDFILDVIETLVPPKRNPITVPRRFTLTNNIQETMTFYEDLLKLAKKQEPIYIDFTNVTEITPDAILYFILTIEEIRAMGKHALKGNAPLDNTCKKMLQESGFLSYVRSPLNKYKNDTDILTIREGVKTETQTAKKVIKYVKKHLGIKKSNKHTKAIYALIIEAMTNTKNHSSKEGKQSKKWYLMAHYCADGEIEFTFLDNGETIPKTIRKNFGEIIGKIFGTVSTTDSKLIDSALKGSFRTQTKERKRGRGLPKMYKLSQSGHIKDLVIVSNKGYLNVSDGINYDLDERFHGTLISWKATTKIATTIIDAKVIKSTIETTNKEVTVRI